MSGTHDDSEDHHFLKIVSKLQVEVLFRFASKLVSSFKISVGFSVPPVTKLVRGDLARFFLTAIF